MSEEFKKYPSIELSTHAETLRKFCEYNPSFIKETFVIQEKVHGTNTQINFYPSGEITIGTRKRILESEMNHHNVRSLFDDMNVYKEYRRLFTYISDVVKESHSKITLFGEWFGSGICKGINYGEEKQFVVFDIAIDDKIQSMNDIIRNFDPIIISAYFVHKITVVNSLEEALEFDCNILSVYSPTGDICEGVVIKPRDKVYLKNDKPFYIKKKNPKFSEKSKSKKERKRVIRENEDILFEYINEMRVQSVMSKEGKIKSKKDIGKYIKLIQTDAIEDFRKDKPEFELQDYQIKFVAKTIVRLLQSYL